jgi:hypothetical protein
MPDYSGIWVGEYLLTSCRSAFAGGCKDAPRREPVRIELTQQGNDLRGSVEFLGVRRPFMGFISVGPGIAGLLDSDISVRLTQIGETFTGMIVNDNYASLDLNLSKRYDIVSPLRRF